MDTERLKTYMAAGVEDDKECLRAADALGDAIAQLLKEGVNPYHIASTMLMGAAELMEEGSAPDLYFNFGKGVKGVGDWIMERARKADPGVYDFDH